MKRSSLDVLIVEDSLSYALELEMVCEGLGLNIVGHAEDSATALDIIFSDDPDLVLMDIDIGGKLSGIEIGQKIKHLNCSILYITSYNDNTTINKAHESNIVDFLIKPVSENILKATLARIMKEKHDIDEEGDAEIASVKETKALFFLKNNVYHKINIEDIIYIESDDNYCKFHFADCKMYQLRITMKEVEEKTAGHKFLRCHRRYIINTGKITGIDTKTNKLFCNAEIEIPFSRSVKKEILKLAKSMK